MIGDEGIQVFEYENARLLLTGFCEDGHDAVLAAKCLCTVLLVRC